MAAVKPSVDEDVVYSDGSVEAEDRRPGVAGPSVKDAAHTLPPGGATTQKTALPCGKK